MRISLGSAHHDFERIGRGGYLRYLRFVIRDYKAITGPLEVNVDRRSLIPIVGINESGKTTILQAIFAFDHFNDELNDEGRHLQDTANLFKTASPGATIEADIALGRPEFLSILADLEEENASLKPRIATIRKRRRLPAKLCLTRNLVTKIYSVLPPIFDDAKLDHGFAEETVAHCPYILFFDDFRDKVDERIEIAGAEKDSPTGWLGILERLFKATDKALSVYSIAGMEERQRRSALSKVERHLNATLTREWQNFRLDDRNALEISIDLVSEAPVGNPKRYFLKMGIVETDAAGDKHYFFISDRSKGFFWFFNFVMKLEFNPKVLNEDPRGTVYLLDEPGSYLHASAQSKLCSKLKSLSEKNRVVYCTHSHYLLNPEVIPISSISVADKDANGAVRLMSIFQHKGSILEQRSAFQPVLDALQIKPFILDMTHERIIVAEGICDYYSLEMFKQARQLSILPSVGADSIKFYVSLLIAWQVNFWALWDNDEVGRKARADAERLFGSDIAARRLKLLPKADTQKNRILQDLFDGQDLVLLRTELGLPNDVSFEKTVTAWYYSSRRNELLGRVSAGTRRNFEELFDSLALT
jgi:hypothetical protein